MSKFKVGDEVYFKDKPMIEVHECKLLTKKQMRNKKLKELGV